MVEKYLGIVPYDENCGFEFTGRNDEIWALYERIYRNDYTVYYAASGEGKSSLIKAGLIPILRRRDYLPIYIVFDDKEFSGPCSLAHIINDRIEAETQSNNVIFEQSEWSKSVYSDELSETLKDNIWWKLRNYCFKRGDVELKPLYIFDQFEEVFTKTTYEWVDGFFSQLEELSTDYLPDSLLEILKPMGRNIPAQKHFKVLFSLRTEYLGDIDYWCVQKHNIPALQENRMCLKPLTIQGAREIISLNKSVFENYTDDIIKGCGVSTVNMEADNHPCVYALILSVVCQTLSRMPSVEEREHLLEKLKNDGEREQSIDNILLQFYKAKLKDVGLDYERDEYAIFNIEHALVDENGKRCRRDSDEAVLRPLMKWISLLSRKSNGLIKVVGKRKSGDDTIMTVEFPHDRLCKAIDTSRKERQLKRDWKHARQGKWIQFISMLMSFGCVALLYNSLLSSVTNIFNLIFYSKIAEIWAPFIHSYLRFKQSYYGEVLLDADFSVSILLGVLIVFAPILTLTIARKERTWSIMSLVTSSVGMVIFAFLCLRNESIDFQNGYVKTITFICLIVSIIAVIKSFLNYRESRQKAQVVSPSHQSVLSYWPLWGGLFFFGCYFLYDCTSRTTFGISEPIDSALFLFLLPLLLTGWMMGVLNMAVKKKERNRSIKSFAASIAISILIVSLRILEKYHSFDDNLLPGVFYASLIFLVLWIICAGYVLWNTESNTPYFTLSKTRIFFSVAIESVAILSIFIINLGYNPLAIYPGSVSSVHSWRTVDVFMRDSLGRKIHGIVYADDGDTIVPFCSLQLGADRIQIESKCENSPFKYGETTNSDGSLSYDDHNHILTARYLSTPVWERKFKDVINKGLRDGTIESAVEYYAAETFLEIRKANFDYVLKGDVYNIEKLHHFQVLDSLQGIALSKELEKMASRGSISANDNKQFEDSHLVGFLSQLTKSLLLCMIKDRADKSDMPAMHQLGQSFLLVFFPAIEGLNGEMHNNIEIEYGNVPYRINNVIKTDDFNEGKLYAWYDMFNVLCINDMSYNTKDDENVGEKLKELIEILQCRPSPFHKAEYTECMQNSLSIAQEALSLMRTVETDQSFNRLKTDVSDVLLPIMDSQISGIYNNMYEEIVKQLINVSVLRGYSIANDTIRLKKYYSEKDGLYNAFIDKANDNKNSYVELSDAEDLINSHRSYYEALINRMDSLILAKEKEFSKREDSLEM